MILPVLIATLACRINRHQAHVIRYLREENRIRKAKLKGKRISLTDTDRRRLAVLAHPIERKQLKDLSTIATPDTLRRWHRRLVVQAPSRLPKGKPLGRPRVATEIKQLVMRMATENPCWGYRRIQGALSNLGYHIHNTTVRNILRRSNIDPAPIRGKAGMSWSQFIKLHLDVMAASGFFKAWLSLMTSFWPGVTWLGWHLHVQGSHLLGLICHSILSVPTLVAHQWHAPWSACLTYVDTRGRFVFSRRHRVLNGSYSPARFVSALPLPSQSQVSPIEQNRAPPDTAGIDLTFAFRRIRGQRGRGDYVSCPRQSGRAKAIQYRMRVGVSPPLLTLLPLRHDSTPHVASTRCIR